MIDCLCGAPKEIVPHKTGRSRANTSRNEEFKRATSVSRRSLFRSAANTVDLLAYDSDYDLETSQEPELCSRPRGRTIVSRADTKHDHGDSIHKYDHDEDIRQSLASLIEACPLFTMLPVLAIPCLVDAIPVITLDPNEPLHLGGEAGSELVLVLSGKVNCHYQFPDARGKVIRTLHPGDLCGNIPLVLNDSASITLYSCGIARIGRISHEVYCHVFQQATFDQNFNMNKVLRHSRSLSTLDDDSMARLIDSLELRMWEPNEDIICQGDKGWECFVMLSGEAVAKVQTGLVFSDVQEHSRYTRGDLFGERAFLSGCRRAATVTAVTQVECLCLSKSKVERLLGCLVFLEDTQYLTDPRKLLADFYNPGTYRGPCGVVEHASDDIEVSKGNVDPRASLMQNKTTHWFSVYRPTSRDAIAKMLSGVAVGKGLNVKGKSAKKGALSGFVPFLQISDNSHKSMIEESLAGARSHIYFKHPLSREQAMRALVALKNDSVAVEAPCTVGTSLKMEDPEIHMLDDYSHSEPCVWGLDVPEALFREAYIIRPDIRPPHGWEPGRPSEPAYMDMNFHSLREDSTPTVVLLQFDSNNAMNPWGLLVSYAERVVKPVVSDFDTFTVGSLNMSYDPIAKEQADLAVWSLNRTEEILEKQEEGGWMQHWFEVKREYAEKGFDPNIPKYGFGDPTSIRLIESAVDATLSCGAVRHGAECFNFLFPQDLDDNYLVVWDGFDEYPWSYLSEVKLREFLIARAAEGFSFPLNPVWIVRDMGWFDVLHALMSQPNVGATLDSWYPPESGIINQCLAIRKRFPNGFKFSQADERKSVARENGELLQWKVERLYKRNKIKLVHRSTVAFQKLNLSKRGTVATPKLDCSSQDNPSFNLSKRGTVKSPRPEGDSQDDNPNFNLSKRGTVKSPRPEGVSQDNPQET
eukprot:TRINITY_DN5108_c0_g1_i1.p1 TRINITY_DN5108_c0_g1~~TRINITY_DN5108_c0_g1_i1.p1  ORF type:complete len:923 (+),score=68.23 TRINITY_DN5108_c0_g1_i1:40-2808(+)